MAKLQLTSLHWFPQVRPTCQNLSIVFQCFSSSKWDSLKFMGQTHSNSQQAEVWFGSIEFSEESSNVRVTSVSPEIRLQHAFRCFHGDVLVQFLHSSVLWTAAVSITLSVSIIATIKQNPQTYSSSNCRQICDESPSWTDIRVGYGIH